jgi:hypothetical protein
MHLHRQYDSDLSERGTAKPCAAKSDPTLVEYVSVTATQTFNPVVPWASLFFPASLSAGTLTRIQ